MRVTDPLLVCRRWPGVACVACAALQETNGDIEEAKAWLRKKGILKSASRAERQASMGFVVVATRGRHRAAIVEVRLWHRGVRVLAVLTCVCMGVLAGGWHR